MLAIHGNMLKIVKIESQGRYLGEWFCYYEYKEECESEANKIRWPNPKDRWYEDYLTQKQIQQAINGGAEFIDKENRFKFHNCEHEWIRIGHDWVGYVIVCNKCGADKKFV